MNNINKIVLLILGYSLFFILCINTCSDGSDEFQDEAIVSAFYKKEVSGGTRFRSSQKVYYPEILFIFDKDSYYFSKYEWNKFNFLKIGDIVKVKVEFEDSYDDSLPNNSINSLTKEEVGAIEKQIENLNGYKISINDKNRKVIGRKPIDLEIYTEMNKYFSEDKLFLHGFIFFTLLVFIFHKEKKRWER